MTEGYLDKIYAAGSDEERQNIYADWAKSYDEELTQSGYATPARCAAALHAFVADAATPVLDIGCGTGLSGLALRLAGFEIVDGLDVSSEMLEQARAKSVYRTLQVISPDDALPQGYDVMSAIGVIGAGAAPIDLLDRMVQALAPGGLLVFSFNDHTLADPVYEARLSHHTEHGGLVELFREHGPHLTSEDLGATVYVFRKS